MPEHAIAALLPRTPGHQFVLYGDACSGIPGALHEATFASVNSVIRRVEPQPEFILFLGDEIIGLTADADALRAQWRHWLDQEMRWLDRRTIPLWHTTGNHTAYDTMSENVFREVLDLPRNGPPGQEGLSYWVRRGDLLLVFVHTLWTGLGGEGHVETEWLEGVLRQHADARHKLVLGHHPVYPINGFSGPYQREIGPEHAGRFWDLLVEADVLAYVCSHILAFDVQVQQGVLQICTAGAGTAHRMPEGVEYLHCVQAALDEYGLRYQVLDTDGVARERLEWPMAPVSAEWWRDLARGEGPAPVTGRLSQGRRIDLRFRGRTAPDTISSAQTLLSAFSPGSIAPIWIGLQGPRQTLTLIMGREPGRSPHYWIGPSFPAGENFDLHLAINPEMGPGGVLYRPWGEGRWGSMAAASATGLETLQWTDRWSVGHGQHGIEDRSFAGPELTVAVAIG